MIVLPFVLFLTLFSFIFVCIFQVVSWIMTIWLFGSVMIFVLARVLGGDVNYSQCLGVIGYSVLPLFVVGLILPVTHSLPWLHFIIKVRRTQDRCQDFFKVIVTTIQDERFHWILNFTVSLNQTSLNLNPTYYLNYVDLPMIAYTRAFIKPKLVNN